MPGDVQYRDRFADPWYLSGISLNAVEYGLVRECTKDPHNRYHKRNNRARFIRGLCAPAPYHLIAPPMHGQNYFLTSLAQPDTLSTGTVC